MEQEVAKTYNCLSQGLNGFAHCSVCPRQSLRSWEKEAAPARTMGAPYGRIRKGTRSESCLSALNIPCQLSGSVAPDGASRKLWLAAASSPAAPRSHRGLL